MDELERAILQAHEGGNQAVLERLQAQYRDETCKGLRTLTRYGPAPTLIERGAPRNGNGATRSTSAPGIVALTPYAKRAISDYWRGDREQETGGFMWGVVADKAILIDSANEAGEGMERGPTHVAYSDAYAEQHEDGAGRPIIGEWHTHPGQPDPEPSPTDRKCWARHAAKAGIPWASIIVGDNGSPYWPMRAFITEFRGGNSRTYPAALVEEE